MNFIKKLCFGLLISILCLGGQIGPAFANSWAINSANPGLTNYQPVTISNELFLKHEIAISDAGNPLVQEDTLYIVRSGGKRLTALSLETKAILWEFTPPNEAEIRNTAIVNGNIVVSTYGKTYYLNDEGSNKSIIWESDVWGNYISYDNKFLYVATPTEITSINIETGQKGWFYTIPTTVRLDSTLSTSDAGVFFVTYDLKDGGYKLFKLNKENGQVLWTTNYPNPTRKPMIVNDKIYMTYQNNLSAINTSNGTYVFNKNIGTKNFEGIDDVLSSNGENIFTRQNGKLLALDPQTGAIKFQTEYQDVGSFGSTSISRGPILVTSNQIIIENNGNLKFFDSKTGNPEHVLSYGVYKLDPVLVTDKYFIASNWEKLFIYATPTDSQHKDPDGNVQPEQPPAPNPTGDQLIYVVQSGDTLWKIASKYGVSVKQITEINKLDPSAYLWVGQNLTIPKPQKTHVVQAGDTLWKLANQYSVTIQSIVELNKLSSASNIWVGQKLLIPDTVAKSYTVQAGDTLWKIASQHNTTVQAIVTKNNLDPAKYLYVGQKLIIP